MLFWKMLSVSWPCGELTKNTINIQNMNHPFQNCGGDSSSVASVVCYQGVHAGRHQCSHCSRPRVGDLAVIALTFYMITWPELSWAECSGIQPDSGQSPVTQLYNLTVPLHHDQAFTSKLKTNLNILILEASPNVRKQPSKFLTVCYFYCLLC